LNRAPFCRSKSSQSGVYVYSSLACSCAREGWLVLCLLGLGLSNLHGSFLLPASVHASSDFACNASIGVRGRANECRVHARALLQWVLPWLLSRNAAGSVGRILSLVENALEAGRAPVNLAYRL